MYTVHLLDHDQEKVMNFDDYNDAVEYFDDLVSKYDEKTFKERMNRHVSQLNNQVTYFKNGEAIIEIYVLNSLDQLV